MVLRDFIKSEIYKSTDLLEFQNQDYEEIDIVDIDDEELLGYEVIKTNISYLGNASVLEIALKM